MLGVIRKPGGFMISGTTDCRFPQDILGSANDKPRGAALQRLLERRVIRRHVSTPIQIFAFF